MKVLLVYDKVQEVAATEDMPEDLGAEYEDARTIESLLDAVRACGHEPVELVLEEEFPIQVRRFNPDLVFNIAEGVRGPMRESVVPTWLDHLNIPYTGSDGRALAISLDKALAKTIVAARGIRTPAFRRVSHVSELQEIDLEFPLFVKPNAEGSSMGIRRASRVETPEELRHQVAWVLRSYREDCLVEEFAPGREFCVGILGNEEPRLLPIVHLRSPHGFYSYEDKQAHRKELICPANLPRTMADEMCFMALEAFRALRCRDLARVDFKLDSAGRPAFLEINPLPGLSSEYGIFPAQARAVGITHEELIGQIIELAVRRFFRQREVATI